MFMQQICIPEHSVQILAGLLAILTVFMGFLSAFLKSFPSPNS